MRVMSLKAKGRVKNNTSNMDRGEKREIEKREALVAAVVVVASAR